LHTVGAGLGWAGLGWAGLAWLLTASTPANAQGLPVLGLTWHETEIDPAGVPQGVSIRNWGPTGDNFLFYDHVEPVYVGGALTSYDNVTSFAHYSCDAAGGGYDYCETVTLEDDLDVGSTINTGFDPSDTHAMHPASAIRKVSSDFELTLSRAEPEGTHTCADIGGLPTWDLMSYVYRTDTASITDTLAIQRADNAADCQDHGKTELAYDGSTAHACYTVTTQSTGDLVQCNEDDGSSGEWGSAVDLARVDEEDHPSFVLDGSDRVVAAHAYDSSDDHSIEVRLADGSTSELISLHGSTKKNHPETSWNNDVLRVVYRHDQGANADIAYKRCHTSGTNDCSDWDSPGDPNDDWQESYIVEDKFGASHVEHVVDVGAQREFVAFYFNGGSAGAPKQRVLVGSRCLHDDWEFDLPRTPDTGTDDQVLNYGTPSLVLDRVEEVVHIAFIEADEFDDQHADPEQDGQIYWMRANYDGLDSCL